MRRRWWRDVELGGRGVCGGGCGGVVDAGGCDGVDAGSEVRSLLADWFMGRAEVWFAAGDDFGAMLLVVAAFECWAAVQPEV